MTPSELPEPTRPVGLRERKKAKTRAAVRAQAIRMFAEQGYAATTVEQIAEAAEISPSTFFGYFASKEMVIVADEYDQVILDAFRNQPAETPPIRAFRNSVKAAMALIPRTAAEEQQEYTRRVLTQTVPELRSAMLEQYSVSLDELAEIIAQRTGHTNSDLRVRVVAGALIGVGMAVMMESWGGGPEPAGLDAYLARFDQGMDLLERGLPL